MLRRSDVSFRYHIDRDIGDHSKTSLRRLIGTQIRANNLSRRSDVPNDT